MLKKLIKNKKGFTLTELIVVIAILGVLAAVVTPSVLGYISDAKVSADKANANTIDSAVKRLVANDKLKLDTTTHSSLQTDKDAIKTIIMKEVDPFPTINDTTAHYVLQRTVTGGVCTSVSVKLLSPTTTPVLPAQGADVVYLD
ncbi:MAG: prepilin-type N-terminal cleavage/methylation domain-containing protein [Bacillota bacterium]|nr:prepilin-type N-terminal cleavage/methylation domain-containing protein [Bacillota bacterium]